MCLWAAPGLVEQLVGGQAASRDKDRIRSPEERHGTARRVSQLLSAKNNGGGRGIRLS